MSDLATMVAEMTTDNAHEVHNRIAVELLGCSRCNMPGCGDIHGVENYTVSLDDAVDAAEKIVPGCDWSIDKRDEGDTETWWDATVNETLAQSKIGPAHALILAAIRANPKAWERG